MNDDLIKVLDKLERMNDEITNIQDTLKKATNKNLETILECQYNMLQKLDENK